MYNYIVTNNFDHKKSTLNKLKVLGITCSSHHYSSGRKNRLIIVVKRLYVVNDTYEMDLLGEMKKHSMYEPSTLKEIKELIIKSKIYV